MKVLKFGGSSIGTPERVKAVIEIIRAQQDEEQMAIVFSAFGGITDTLILLSNLALAGNVEYRAKLSDLEKRHLDAVRELISVQRQSGVLAKVKIQINELEDILDGVFRVGECTSRMLDYIMSYGERLSAYILAETLQAHEVTCEFLDSRRVLKTDATYGFAKIDFERTNTLIQDYFKNHSLTQVITGFIGSSTIDDDTTTIGRSGSDYTAAIFASALEASLLEIWTDVDGMMTADPRKVRKAFTVKEMSYEEAMELSHFGAKVVFPSTMQPAMLHRIPIRIRNSYNPTGLGTTISADVKNGMGLIIKGISSVGNISLINIQGSNLVGVVGIAKRLFSKLAEENINVVLISQASSEHSICLAVGSDLVPKANASIKKEFQVEIQVGSMNEPVVQDGMAIVAIVGENMKHNPGTSGRMFRALGKNGINVFAIAQGSSERNISAVISQADTSKALNALHEAFFLSDRKILNVFMIGTGLIGSTLLNMINNQFALLAKENLLEVSVIGVANSSKMLFDDMGLNVDACVDQMKDKGEPMDMPLFVKQMVAFNLSNSIFVDCTSSEEVTNYYQEILEASISIVTPNKKANSGSLEKYRSLRATSFKRGARFYYETNVGAGLPVINTMNDLLLSGDKVMRIEAVLSGTLNFIFSSFVGDRKFSEVVKEAKEKGYTEPDPRDDLNGMDVARKSLILSREIGFPLELSDIKVFDLVPEDCQDDMSIDEFFKRLEKHDTHFESLKNEAESKNEKLRYMAILENGKVTVSLESVGAEHPFYSLSGSDNIILLTTERYHELPMVIRGPGAGASVTAAGVFADIIRIGNYVHL